VLKIGRENEGKYLGGREGRIGSLGGLRGHESAAGEGSAAVEFASIHCSDDSVCVSDCERERDLKFWVMMNYIILGILFYLDKKN